MTKDEIALLLAKPDPAAIALYSFHERSEAKNKQRRADTKAEIHRRWAAAHDRDVGRLGRAVRETKPLGTGKARLNRKKQRHRWGNQQA